VIYLHGVLVEVVLQHLPHGVYRRLAGQLQFLGQAAGGDAHDALGVLTEVLNRLLRHAGLFRAGGLRDVSVGHQYAYCERRNEYARSDNDVHSVRPVFARTFPKTRSATHQSQIPHLQRVVQEGREPSQVGVRLGLVGLLQ
jgi:hypothetical protein